MRHGLNSTNSESEPLAVVYFGPGLDNIKSVMSMAVDDDGRPGAGLELTVYGRGCGSTAKSPNRVVVSQLALVLSPRN